MAELLLFWLLGSYHSTIKPNTYMLFAQGSLNRLVLWDIGARRLAWWVRAPCGQQATRSPTARPSRDQRKVGSGRSGDAWLCGWDVGFELWLLLQLGRAPDFRKLVYRLDGPSASQENSCAALRFKQRCFVGKWTPSFMESIVAPKTQCYDLTFLRLRLTVYDGCYGCRSSIASCGCSASKDLLS